MSDRESDVALKSDNYEYDDGDRRHEEHTHRDVPRRSTASSSNQTAFTKAANRKYHRHLCKKKYVRPARLEAHMLVHTTGSARPALPDSKPTNAAALKLNAASSSKMFSSHLRTVIEKTATEFTDESDTGARFQCPVPACSHVFDPDATLADVWNHCDDSAHEHALYEEDHLRCEMGC